MNPLDSVDPETILTGKSDWITPDLASQLAHHPLDCIETEFPHYLGSVDAPEGFDRPSETHPVFYGCFDWHSAVHSHWALIRGLRLFDDHPDQSEIVRSIDARFTPENVEREVAYFEDHPSFEKPYGWGWLLRLAAELHRWESDCADEWREVLRPLEDRIVELVETRFLPQERPFRVGTHGNSAFALGCVLDYARTVGNDELEFATLEAARRFYLDDAEAPVEYEPLGWDFLSPSLVEADLMRRVLDPGAFSEWLDGFLPDVRRSPYDSILEPVAVEQGSDGGIELHLVGLNVSKAWCLAGIAEALADQLDDHPFVEAFEESARRHAEAGLAGAFTDDYAGSHWLSSFVLYLLTRNEGTIGVV